MGGTEPSFELPPLRARELLLGNGPRFARDAFGPPLAFYVGWKAGGLVAGILLSTFVSILAWRAEKRAERPGFLVRMMLAIVVVQAVVGLVADSERVYLAQPVLVSGAYGTAFLVSAAVGKPLAARFADEMFPFPAEVRASATFRRTFARISVAWGAYLLFRSGLRLAMLSMSSVEGFLLVNFATGVPFTALLMSWSVWYGIRSFRRSEEWGPAIVALEAAGIDVTAALTGTSPVPGQVGGVTPPPSTYSRSPVM